MSYLQIPNGIPDFQKAVISFWFRVPQESFDKLSMASEGAPVMPWIIPLMTFGRPQDVWDGETIISDVGNPVNFELDYDVLPPGFMLRPQITGFTKTGQHPADPCYIGIYCRDSSPILVFNFQMAAFANIVGLNVSMTRVDYYSKFVPPYPPVGFDLSVGTGWEGVVTGAAHSSLEDTIDLSMDIGNLVQPEFFYVNTHREVELDQWHHLLLSVDFSAGIDTHGEPQHGDGFDHSPENTASGTNEAVRLWYALDDVNYNGADNPENMGDFFVDGGSDPNAILTGQGYSVANDATGNGFNLLWPPSTYNYTGIAVPSDGSEFGIPASHRYVNNILSVEMAEFQMRTGVTLDTGIEANRRAFIDYERGGNFTMVPVDPVEQPPSTDHPAGVPAPAEKLLKKKPEILLHGSDRWISGENTGSLGVDVDTDGNEVLIPSGQFQPTGEIRKYTPDPSLSKSASSSTRRKAFPIRLTKKPADARL